MKKRKRYPLQQHLIRDEFGSHHGLFTISAITVESTSGRMGKQRTAKLPQHQSYPRPLYRIPAEKSSS